MRRIFVSLCTLLGVFTLCAPTAKAANYTIQWALGEIPGLAATSVALLIEDQGGDGLPAFGSGAWLGLPTGSPSPAAGITVGANDVILDSAPAINFGPGNGFQGGTASSDPALGNANNLYIVWFNGLTPGNPVDPGRAAGSFRTNLLDPPNSINAPMVTPPDGQAVTVGGFSTNVGGVHNPNSFIQNNGNVIPEPSAFALFGLGLSALLLRRRR